MSAPPQRAASCRSGMAGAAMMSHHHPRRDSSSASVLAGSSRGLPEGDDGIVGEPHRCRCFDGAAQLGMKDVDA